MTTIFLKVKPFKCRICDEGFTINYFKAKNEGSYWISLWKKENIYVSRCDICDYVLGCASKDLDGYLGPLGKFIEYCRITAMLPVIPLGIRNKW